MKFANVAIDAPVHRLFTYRIPEGVRAVPGMRAVVPFRKKNKIGIIIETVAVTTATMELKEISLLPDTEPVLSEDLIKLLRWISDYYASPIGETISAALPRCLTDEKELAKKRRERIADGFLGFRKEEKIVLSKKQEEIFGKIGSDFATYLLHGVTGSGKTEIYLQLIERTLNEGKTAILLVPEISLTPQLSGRVLAHFGKDVAVYHSGLTDAARLNEWQKMNDGRARIVVGTRSAVFAPLKNLGLIIVDEEHDHSYKQEDSPRYNARDTAIMRAKLEKAPIVLGSATPSIETLSNARSGKFQYLRLNERFGASILPEIKIIDMRKEPRSELINPHISISLLSEMKKRFARKEQTLLFLNRRGYANFILCHDCGHIPQCPNCKISLTYHKGKNGIVCHYCDIKKPLPQKCPECGSVELKNIGKGTELIEELIRAELPGAVIERLDKDTATTEKRRRDILTRMHKGEIDILIGTQMITKGHDFPNVTLVGIVSADQSIHFPDFRSSERTFQLITQVAGRAGRALIAGTVLIQTYSPEHISILTASENRLDDYIEEELKVRKELNYPPFSRVANLKISGNRERDVVSLSEEIARLINKISSNDAGLKLLGPAPAPLSMLKGKCRWQILLKSSSPKKLASVLLTLREHLEKTQTRGAKLVIDVDPISTM